MRYPYLLSSDLIPQPLLPVTLCYDGRETIEWSVIDPSAAGVVLPARTAEMLGIPAGAAEAATVIASHALSIEIILQRHARRWPLANVTIGGSRDAHLGWSGFLEYFDVNLRARRQIFTLRRCRTLPPLLGERMP